MKHTKEEVLIKIKRVLNSFEPKEDYIEETFKIFSFLEQEKDDYWVVSVDTPIYSPFSDKHMLSLRIDLYDDNLEPFCYYPPSVGYPPSPPLKISKKDDTYFFDGEWIDEK